jgi:hypothetical protein
MRVPNLLLETDASREEAFYNYVAAHDRDPADFKTMIARARFGEMHIELECRGSGAQFADRCRFLDHNLGSESVQYRKAVRESRRGLIAPLIVFLVLLMIVAILTGGLLFIKSLLPPLPQ